MSGISGRTSNRSISRRPPIACAAPSWPLPEPPDLLVLATEIAGVGGLELPVEVSATDSFTTVTDAPERSLAMVARIAVDLADVLLGEETPFCETLDRCKEVSLFLLEQAPGWLAES